MIRHQPQINYKLYQAQLCCRINKKLNFCPVELHPNGYRRFYFNVRTQRVRSLKSKINARICCGQYSESGKQHVLAVITRCELFRAHGGSAAMRNDGDGIWKRLHLYARREVVVCLKKKSGYSTVHCSGNHSLSVMDSSTPTDNCR